MVKRKCIYCGTIFAEEDTAKHAYQHAKEFFEKKRIGMTWNELVFYVYAVVFLHSKKVKDC